MMEMDETVRSAVLVLVGGVLAKAGEMALKRFFAPPPNSVPGFVSLVNELQEQVHALRDENRELQAEIRQLREAAEHGG